MWQITKSFLNPEDQTIIKVDPAWGFSEFPTPGDVKKHLLPVLIDPEANQKITEHEPEIIKDRLTGAPLTEFWMPDKYCKVCYGCEESFTMYRRRHHCRMCGQIFCNNCSSFYIDGMLFNIQGLVRACRLCYEQLVERSERENKLSRKKTVLSVESSKPETLSLMAGDIRSSTNLNVDEVNKNLQNRASKHLESIVHGLVYSASSISADRGLWKEKIVNLVREVVTSVDPDVRNGDSMDIRPYVKIKIIPGGNMEESIYIDGVVFRKNVSHKRMGSEGPKLNPRILLLAGGIEFQRTDTKLSSMDTLIEQEDKYMEILVEKIMSLKPDIILVGKAVTRRAQELLCDHSVVVMQNVKLQLLERIGRMTGAMLLPSTDHMIKQFGQECLGTCEQFRLRVVQDDPEKATSVKPSRILKHRISRGSTYAYVEGCPAERGCSIVLRGDNRLVLSEVKRIIKFCIVVAYHLRLEVAYYNDRFAELPESDDDEIYDDGSDVDDQFEDMMDGDDASGKDRNKVNSTKDFDEATEESTALIMAKIPRLFKRRERLLLSTSLDIDISLPYRRDLIGTNHFLNTKSLHSKESVENHQSLLIASLVMGEGSSGPVQKTMTDVKGIKYYTKQDVALGRFLIENCFQINQYMSRETRMLDQVLSFIHRTGRIDISVHRVDDHHKSTTSGSNIPGSTNIMEDAIHAEKDPMRLPIFMSSYCKECCTVVTPVVMMREETWKMSFGKFLEIFLYNRSARCRVGGCRHSLRDNHTLTFRCEGYEALFNFVPLHAYALHVRTGMSFPEEFHSSHSAEVLKTLPVKQATLIEDFRLALIVLEREIKEVLTGEDLKLAMADVAMMESELQATTVSFLEELLRTYEILPLKLQENLVDNQLKASLTDKLMQIRTSKKMGKTSGVNTTAVSHSVDENAPTLSEYLRGLGVNYAVEHGGASSASAAASVTATMMETEKEGLKESDPNSSSGGKESDVVATASLPSPNSSEATSIEAVAMATPVPTLQPSTSALAVNVGSDVTSADVVSMEQPYLRSVTVDFNEDIPLFFPMYHMRETFLRASRWNTRIDTIYKFLESVRHMMMQQQLHAQQGQQTGHILSTMMPTQPTTAEDTAARSSFLALTGASTHTVNDIAAAASAAIADEVQSQPNHSDTISTTDELVEPTSPVTNLTGNLSRALSFEELDATRASMVAQTEEEATALRDSTITPPQSTQSPVNPNLSSSKSAPIESSNPSLLGMISNNEVSTATTSVKSTGVPGGGGNGTNSNATPLQRALQEFSKKTVEKPMDKMSRITKAISRFLVLGNKEASAEDTMKFFVPLGDFGGGRFGLKPGRKGEVIPVHEDQYATIIAHALASQSYYDSLQESLREEYTEQEDLFDRGGTGGGLGENTTHYEDENMTPRCTSTDARADDSFDVTNINGGASSAGFGNRSHSTDIGGKAASGHSALMRKALNSFSNPDPKADAVAKGNRHRTHSDPTNNAALSSIPEQREDADDLLEGDDHDAHMAPPSRDSLRRIKSEKQSSESSKVDRAFSQLQSSSLDLSLPSSVSNFSTVFNSGRLFGYRSPEEGAKETGESGGEAHGPLGGKKKSIKFSDNPTIVDLGESDGVKSGGEEVSPTTSSGGAGLSGAEAKTGLPGNTSSTQGANTHSKCSNEKQMISQHKSYIRVRFDDLDDKGNVTCKFQCQVYWAKQFEAVRTCYFREEDNQHFIRSLCMSSRWLAQGGKSGAAFSKSLDDRLVIKVISRVELQMFLEFAPAYFEYMAKAYYQNLPTVLCKILGVYTVRYDNRETGRKVVDNVVVMENIFYQRNITRTFDLKGSSRARYVDLVGEKGDTFDEALQKRRRLRRRLKEKEIKKNLKLSKNNQKWKSSETENETENEKLDLNKEESDEDSILEEHELMALCPPRKVSQVLLDDNLMELTEGRPFPLKHRAKLFFHKAVQNDTLFLSIVNVVDYSILVGFDETKNEIVVGIIDYMRQYDIVKKMERMGKSVGMLTGQAEPTIIQPSQYRKRFSLAMERYFMVVPDKWISHDS